MAFIPWLEAVLMRACDGFYALCPQAEPVPEQVRKCRIISHRGIHDNREIKENTLEAFDRVLACEGVWGIELDFRWTQDLTPVVIHDPDLIRVFGESLRVGEIDFSVLRREIPDVPTLDEVVRRYGGKLHLMVEAKEEHYPDPLRQNEILRSVCSPLTPKQDFHLLSLTPKMLKLLDFIEPSAKLLVAEFNQFEYSRTVLEHKYAGLEGHYLLINRRLVDEHKQAGQQLGTGYSNSRNCLYRELNRGIDWIFSERAEEMAAIRNSILLRNEMERNPGISAL